MIASPACELAALVVPRLAAPPAPGTAEDDPAWSGAARVPVDRWRREGSGHRPRTTVRLARHQRTLHLLWSVDDLHVVSRTTGINGPVCRDSCVEFFVGPAGCPGYFNLELNAGGSVHLGYGTDAPWRGGEAARRLVDPGLIQDGVRVATSLPAVVDPERHGPCRWLLRAELDLDLLAAAAGTPVEAAGMWQGNFYKCADRSSHPHWASWSPLGEVLDFHQPARFGALVFAP
ncbi:MAG: carbohydrate-binding family 9-like protein [Planctomycetes bacterium]|nr:carbohydrate-binding family 9-like protein [Planctomycetota bacterium]